MTKFDLSVYPNLLKAAELLDESNYSQAQLDAYDRHLMAVYDINRSGIESFDKGHEEGLTEGREEGVEQGKLAGRLEGLHLSRAIIKELKRGELSHQEIADKFLVPVDEVKMIAEDLG